MLCDEDCRTAVFGKTERTVGWEGNGELTRVELVRHCKGKPAETDRRYLPSLNHSFTLDLVVLHRDYDVIVQAQDIASKWLQEMGLALKPSKTRIGHTLHPVEGLTGFDFFSFHVRQYPVGQTKTGKTGQGKPLGFKTLIKPSKAGQRRHVGQMHEAVRRLRGAPQEALIKRLNPIIGGWSNY